MHLAFLATHLCALHTVYDCVLHMTMYCIWLCTSYDYVLHMTMYCIWLCTAYYVLPISVYYMYRTNHAFNYVSHMAIATWLQTAYDYALRISTCCAWIHTAYDYVLHMFLKTCKNSILHDKCLLTTTYNSTYIWLHCWIYV